MLVTDQGKMIRTTVGDIRVMGRNTQGVTIFRVADDEHVVSVAKIEESEEEEIELEDGDEIAPDDGAIVGESELDKPADPERSRPPSMLEGSAIHGDATSAPASPASAVRESQPLVLRVLQPIRRKSSMPLPNNALVLVADGRKMLFFRNHGDENQIDLRTEAHDAARGPQGQRDQDRRARRHPPERRLWPLDLRGRPTSTSRRRTAGSRMPPTSSRRALAQRFRRARHRCSAQGARRAPQGLHKEVEKRLSAPSTRK